MAEAAKRDRGGAIVPAAEPATRGHTSSALVKKPAKRPKKAEAIAARLRLAELEVAALRERTTQVAAEATGHAEITRTIRHGFDIVGGVTVSIVALVLAARAFARRR